MKLIATQGHRRLPKRSFAGGARWRAGAGLGILVLLLATAGGTARALNGDAPKEKAAERVVAKVNGMPILASDLEMMVRAQVQGLQVQFANDPQRLAHELAEVRQHALDGLIDFQLLEDEFFRLGGMISQEDIDEDVRHETQAAFRGDREALLAELSTLGMTFDKYRQLRERMIIASAVREKIANNVEVTEEMVRRYYKENVQRWRGPESVRLHTLTVRRTEENARALAEGLRTRLLNGGDFAEVAREYSKDSRAEEGGAWPWTSLADISERVGQVIGRTKVGMLSEVIEQPDAYIVLRVDGRRESGVRPYESVSEDVRAALVEKLRRERVENRLCRLREAAYIQKMGLVHG